MKVAWPFFLFILTYSCVASAEGEPWKTVTQLHFINGKKVIELKSGEGVGDYNNNKPLYFELSEDNSILTQVEKSKYPPLNSNTSKKSKLVEIDETHEDFINEDNKVISITYSDCYQNSEGIIIATGEQSEGGRSCKVKKVKVGNTEILLVNLKHNAYYDVGYAKIINDQLWISIGINGEYGWRGSGFQVYSLKNKKIILNSTDKNSDDDVSDFIVEQKTDNIWVIGSDGLTKINSKTLTRKDIYIHRGFSQITYKPEYILSNQFIEDNYIAKMFLKLNYIPSKSFYDKIKGISPSDIVEIWQNGKTVNDINLLTITKLVSESFQINKYNEEELKSWEHLFCMFPDDFSQQLSSIVLKSIYLTPPILTMKQQVNQNDISYEPSFCITYTLTHESRLDAKNKLIKALSIELKNFIAKSVESFRVNRYVDINMRILEAFYQVYSTLKSTDEFAKILSDYFQTAPVDQSYKQLYNQLESANWSGSKLRIFEGEVYLNIILASMERLEVALKLNECNYFNPKDILSTPKKISNQIAQIVMATYIKVTQSKDNLSASGCEKALITQLKNIKGKTEIQSYIKKIPAENRKIINEFLLRNKLDF